MALHFQVRQPISLPVDATAFSMERLGEMTAQEVRRLPIWSGNRQVPCSELFDVSGSGEDRRQIWSGDCSKVKSIGTGLATGEIRIEGNAGAWLGAAMAGGAIRVSGSAGDRVGAEMRGGRITVLGNAGDHVGAAFPGCRRGMTGGEILIHGDAGAATGVRMRRGLIAVAGNVGTATGGSMIAGTILVGGTAGSGTGVGMKRGTILFLRAQSPACESAGFQFAMRGTFTFVELLLRHLSRRDFPISLPAQTSSFRLSRGDLLELGMGEILHVESNMT